MNIPLEEFLDTSYSDNPHPAHQNEDNNNVQIQTQDLSITPLLSHVNPECYAGNLDHESNIQINQNSAENALENGTPTIETPLVMSQRFDNYSLHFVYSSGIRYCASLKKSGEENLGHNRNHPMLTSPNDGREIGKSALGENHRAPLKQYPEISRYVGNLRTFLRGEPSLQQKEKAVAGLTLGGSKSEEEHIQANDMKSTKNQNNSYTKNRLPSNRENEPKEVSKGEYWNALRRKTKNISKGTSTHSGIPKVSPKKSDDEKWKAILWNVRDCKDSMPEALDIPTFSEGIQQAEQNQIFQFNPNHNYPEQASNNNSSSSQILHGFQNNELLTEPSLNHGSRNGGCPKDANIEESFLILDDKEDNFSGFWNECGTLPPFGDDYSIPQALENSNVNFTQALENNNFQIHGDDKNTNFTNQVLQQNPSSSFSLGYNTNPNFQTKPNMLHQVIGIECGQEPGENSSYGSKFQVFTSIRNPNPTPTMIESTKVSTKKGCIEGSPIKGLIGMENPEIEGLGIFMQDQTEFGFGLDWTNNMLFGDIFDSIDK